MSLKFFSDRECELMWKYDCRITKVYMGYDGVGGDGMVRAMDGVREGMLSKGEGYIEKRGVGEMGYWMEVVVFGKREGMDGWLREFPGDIRFIGSECSV